MAAARRATAHPHCPYFLPFPTWNNNTRILATMNGIFDYSTAYCIFNHALGSINDMSIAA